MHFFSLIMVTYFSYYRCLVSVPANVVSTKIPSTFPFIIWPTTTCISSCGAFVNHLPLLTGSPSHHFDFELKFPDVKKKPYVFLYLWFVYIHYIVPPNIHQWHNLLRRGSATPKELMRIFLLLLIDSFFSPGKTKIRADTTRE